MSKKRILITGAAGNIGKELALYLSPMYELKLIDVHPLKKDIDCPFMIVDIADLTAVKMACEDIDIVIHLAADSSPNATWESLLPNNIIGLYNIFEAASAAGCQRVIFASSVHAILGYPEDMQIHDNMPARPSNLYGATKVWGEAVASVYAAQKNISAICLRLGWVQDHRSLDINPASPYLNDLLTNRDLFALIDKAINAPENLRFRVFHALSDNKAKRMDITPTREILGYEPQDDGFKLAG